MMKELVIDASVVIKWLIEVNEANVEMAVKLKDDAFQRKKYSLIVPTFWIYEIGNAMLYKMKVPEEQDKAWEYVLNLPLQSYHFTEKEHLEILKLARTHHTTYYDTSYYYLAKIRACKMITADDKFIRAMNDKRIKHLKQYPF